VVGGEAVGILDDDGELGGEAVEEVAEVVVEVGGDEVGGDGAEKEGGGGEGCGGGEDGFGRWEGLVGEHGGWELEKQESGIMEIVFLI